MSKMKERSLGSSQCSSRLEMHQMIYVARNVVLEFIVMYWLNSMDH